MKGSIHGSFVLSLRRVRATAAGWWGRRRILRFVSSLVLGQWVCLLPGVSRAEGRWVDDALVLPGRRARLSAGFGWAIMGQRIYRTSGAGLDLEQALGLGYGFEFGSRYGTRLNRGGRGLRADEFARAADSEKFGTGSSIIANPELRLTWKLVGLKRLEVAIEQRVVLPIPTDPDLTLLFGLRLRKHVPGLWRVDVSGYSAQIWQKYHDDRALAVAFAAPAWVWVEPLRMLSVGVMAELRHRFATRYTESQSRLTLGAALGYRLGASDLQLALYFTDVLIEPALRVGTEPLSAFLPAVYNDAARRIGVGLVYSIRL